MKIVPYYNVLQNMNGLYTRKESSLPGMIGIKVEAGEMESIEEQIQKNIDQEENDYLWLESEGGANKVVVVVIHQRDKAPEDKIMEEVSTRCLEIIKHLQTPVDQPTLAKLPAGPAIKKVEMPSLPDASSYSQEMALEEAFKILKEQSPDLVMPGPVAMLARSRYNLFWQNEKGPHTGIAAWSYDLPRTEAWLKQKALVCPGTPHIVAPSISAPVEVSCAERPEVRPESLPQIPGTNIRVSSYVKVTEGEHKKLQGVLTYIGDSFVEVLIDGTQKTVSVCPAHVIKSRRKHGVAPSMPCVEEEQRLSKKECPSEGGSSELSAASPFTFRYGYMLKTKRDLLKTEEVFDTEKAAEEAGTAKCKAYQALFPAESVEVVIVRIEQKQLIATVDEKVEFSSTDEQEFISLTLNYCLTAPAIRLLDLKLTVPPCTRKAIRSALEEKIGPKSKMIASFLLK